MTNLNIRKPNKRLGRKGLTLKPKEGLYPTGDITYLSNPLVKYALLYGVSRKTLALGINSFKRYIIDELAANEKCVINGFGTFKFKKTYSHQHREHYFKVIFIPSRSLRPLNEYTKGKHFKTVEM